jgi:hypothetical protein
MCPDYLEQLREAVWGVEVPPKVEILPFDASSPLPADVAQDATTREETGQGEALSDEGVPENVGDVRYLTCATFAQDDVR